MRKQGTIVRWEEDRGFGFIRSTGSGAEVFFHVKDFRGGDQRPREGLAVVFEEIHVGGKGPRAMAVQPTGAPAASVPRAASPPRPASRPRQPGGYRAAPRTHAARRSARRHVRQGGSGYVVLALMLAYAATLAWAVWTRRLPFWVLPASAGLNLATFFVYWQDKYAAGTRRWRTPEKTLHLWSLAGGWGGAWLAQEILRHKSNKPSFLSEWWGTVVFHCGGVAAWLWAWG